MAYFVYIAGWRRGRYCKIGSTGDPKYRIGCLRSQVPDGYGDGRSLEILCIEEKGTAREALEGERELHLEFGQHREKGEWFRYEGEIQKYAEETGECPWEGREAKREFAPGKFEHECLRCGGIWWGEVQNPKVCRCCNSRLWNTPRRRTPAGRPRAIPVEVPPSEPARFCPACGRENPEVCRLLGHVYPVERQPEETGRVGYSEDRPDGRAQRDRESVVLQGHHTGDEWGEEEEPNPYAGMTVDQEIRVRLKEYMATDPESDEGVMRGQVSMQVREERKKRAAELADSPAPQLSDFSGQLNSPSGYNQENGPISNQPKDDTPPGDRVRSLLSIPGLKRGSDL